MKSFVVMNIRKNKGNLGALENHLDRTPGMEHMYKNADGSRSHLNKRRKRDISLNAAVNERIAKGYKSTKKIRSDAVKSISIVLTGSHEAMLNIFKNPETRKSWEARSISFLKNEFGKDNIVSLNLHLDEKTPHLHATIVPLTPDGRLSAKEVMGNKTSLKNRLSRYSKVMEPLGLKRGLKGPQNKPEPNKISQHYANVQATSNLQEYLNGINNEYLKRSKLKLSQIESLNLIQKESVLKSIVKGGELNSVLETYRKINSKQRGRSK